MSGYNFKKNNIVFFCLKIVFTFTNSVDPDEMQYYAAFHLVLHCLQSTCLVVSQIQRVTGSTLLPLSNIVNWINNSLPNNGGSMMLLKIGTICATR